MPQITDRIEVKYEKDMWICDVLDSGRNADYAVYSGTMDCADGHRFFNDLRI